MSPGRVAVTIVLDSEEVEYSRECGIVLCFFLELGSWVCICGSQSKTFLLCARHPHSPISTHPLDNGESCVVLHDSSILNCVVLGNAYCHNNMEW